MRFFVVGLALLLALVVLLVTGDVATAQGSYGSLGGYGSYGRSGVLRDGDGYLLPRRDIRLARREARQADRAARWRAAGGYDSAGSTSYEAPAPAEAEPAVSYCAPVAEPLTVIEDCPTGICPRRQFLLGGKRRRAIFN